MSVARKLTDFYTSKNNLNTSAMGWFNKIMVADTNTGMVQDITDLDKEHYESFLDAMERLRIAYSVIVGREGKECLDEPPASNCIKHAVSSSFYCQREIEGKTECETQCDHCKEYYKPLEQ